MLLCACVGLAGTGMFTFIAIQSGVALGGPQPEDVPDPEPISDLPLYLEPVAGLTTLTHPAPDETGVPIGTTLSFRQLAPPDAEVVWIGADEMSRTSSESMAVCRPLTLGDFLVRAVVYGSDGVVLDENECTLHVLATSLEDIKVGPIVPTVVSVEVDDDSPFEVTWDYYSSAESIAKLTEIVNPFTGVVRKLYTSRRTGGSLSPKGSHRYATSIGRTVMLSATVDPVEYAPLMAWRVADLTEQMASQTSRRFDEVGTRFIEYGPLDYPAWIEIETYSVEITSHLSGQDIIEQGEPVTFTAITDPPGFEDDITWLSSTKYGTGTPVLGYGPTFTVQFDNTFGEDDGVQWLGVRADIASLGQDQINGSCCVAELEFCAEVTSFVCKNAGGFYEGDGTTCGLGACGLAEMHCGYKTTGLTFAGCTGTCRYAGFPKGTKFNATNTTCLVAATCPAAPQTSTIACTAAGTCQLQLGGPVNCK